MSSYPGMTNLAAAVATLEAACGDLLEIYDRQWREIAAADAKAAANDDLVGRYYQESVGDGRALYEICWVHNGKAYLRHLAIGDAYRALTLERLATPYKDPFDPDGFLFAADLAFVAENVRARDALRALFARA